MKFPRQYLDRLETQIQAIAASQMHAIEKGADWFAECLMAERWIYIFGTGHSHIMAEELFYRAGGLARAIPMLDERLMLHRGAAASTDHERNPALAGELLERYRIAGEDLLVVVSNSGRNPLPVELARRVREIGARIIALVNVRQAHQTPSRHASGRKLTELADLVIDNCGYPGDAAVAVESLGHSIGATSTIAGCLILQMIVCGAVEAVVAAGRKPEIYQSSNFDDVDHNADIIRRYRHQIPHL